jgi:hypothetical protein
MSRTCSLVAGRGMVALACSAALLAGCTMCPDPYDYSGPVPNGSAPQNDFRARSNGIAAIDAAPRPWPPIVKREANPDSPVVASVEGSDVGEAEQPEVAAGPVEGEAEPALRR